MNKILTIIILINVIISVVLYNLYNKQKEIVETYEFGSKLLEKGINKKIKIKGNKVTVLYKDKEIVKEKIVYVPKEGTITIIEKDNGSVETQIKNKGFTLRYGFGIGFQDKLYPQLDLKFYYFNQYSLNTFIYQKGAGISISRHLDDWIGENFSNSELFLGYNIINKKFMVGIRSNF